jgi:hypothetical protein
LTNDFLHIFANYIGRNGRFVKYVPEQSVQHFLRGLGQLRRRKPNFELSFFPWETLDPVVFFFIGMNTSTFVVDTIHFKTQFGINLGRCFSINVWRFDVTNSIFSYKKKNHITKLSKFATFLTLPTYSIDPWNSNMFETNAVGKVCIGR